jgi:hypothetical protein
LNQRPKKSPPEKKWRSLTVTAPRSVLVLLRAL